MEKVHNDNTKQKEAGVTIIISINRLQMKKFIRHNEEH
jgi:hypothetical protein